ncbi:MAG TPA: PAS domain-containing sensor histidine kinase [Draconibacterium sp.]|nr:PAS domain-containing sensor histidine kinase [Draconibacterium sp.]
MFAILSDKFWAEQSIRNKKKLYQLLMVWMSVETFALIILIINSLSGFQNSCIICNILLVAMAALPIFCTINGRINCSVNGVFVLPLVLYAFYFSDFNPHMPAYDTVFLTVFWLIVGLIFLLIFSEQNLKIITYFSIGLITIGFQLFKSNLLIDSISFYKPFVSNPIIAFTSIFLLTYILRFNFTSIIKIHEDKIASINQGITKVLQDSTFSIAQIRAERDEAGNIIQLIVEKVNTTFESTFKINLYEVQEQKADYIFDLIFKTRFDLNKYIYLQTKQKRIHEFHATSLERWYNIHVLQPDYNKFYIIFEDNTKTKNKIAELEENKRRYKVLLEAIPDIFFVIDKDGTYEDFVIKESDLFKIEDANVIGSSIFEVGFPENMAEKIYSCIQTSIKTNSIETIEYQMNTPNGTFLFEMRLAKLNSHSVISIARDITKRKTAEFKLEKALVRAEESDKLKSAFLANLSHEIRTPMNVITNFTRILADSELEPEEKMELNDAISLNGKQLLNMIDNTIHLSKIETQTVDINTRFCNINGVLRDIYNKYLILIPDSKQIKLNLKIDVPNKEFGFETDPNILGEIISLLVDNAVKYTIKGEINITYEMVRNEWVKFSISDTGIGIPEKEFQHIFDRFYRIQNEINGTTSGSGLGLPIVQHYTALLGGELEFESAVGKGSKFWFSLPFKNGKGYLSIV